MTALDKINTTMGRGTVRLARVPASGRWAMKQQLKSPSYTCRWGELPSVR
jgi:DNA polymerase V